MISSGRLHRELLLRTIPRPVALDDARAEGRGELARAVGRVRVHDDDLVAEIDGAQTSLDPVGLVERDDARRQAAVIGHGHLSVGSRHSPYNTRK